MISVKDAQGVTYDAAKHFGVYGLQKITEAQSKRTTVCYSYFQPDGGAEMSPSPKERVYYVVKGSITVNGKDGETHLLESRRPDLHRPGRGAGHGHQRRQTRRGARIYRDALTAAAIFQMKRRFRCMKKVVQPSVNPSGMKGIGGKPKR